MVRIERVWAELVIQTHTEHHAMHILATCMLYQRLAAAHSDPQWLAHHRAMLTRAVRVLEQKGVETL